LKHGPLTELTAPDELPCPSLACGIAILKGFWFL
jgi:hypothetical protein